MANGEPGWYQTALSGQTSLNMTAPFNDFAVSPRTATAMISVIPAGGYAYGGDADDAPRKPPRIVTAPKGSSVSASCSANCGGPASSPATRG